MANERGTGEIGSRMDDRMRSVEGDVGKLKDWRTHTVDPWMGKTASFNEEIGAYIIKLKAREELLDKLSEERHVSNTARLQEISNKVSSRSLIWTVAGVFVAIAGLAAAVLMIVITVKLANQHTMLTLPHLLGKNPITETANEAVIPPLAR